MNTGEVAKHLCDVIEEIQVLSGLDCPSLSGSTNPIVDIPKFDSKIWPIAAGMLSEKIGEDLPDDLNLFCDAETYDPITVAQAAALVMGILTNKENSNKAEEDDG